MADDDDKQLIRHLEGELLELKRGRLPEQLSYSGGILPNYFKGKSQESYLRLLVNEIELHRRALELKRSINDLNNVERIMAMDDLRRDNDHLRMQIDQRELKYRHERQEREQQHSRCEDEIRVLDQQIALINRQRELARLKLEEEEARNRRQQEADNPPDPLDEYRKKRQEQLRREEIDAELAAQTRQQRIERRIRMVDDLRRQRDAKIAAITARSNGRPSKEDKREIENIRDMYDREIEALD